ncbi:saccharopine dehydrogenase NADP-binding domain-containing protein [Kitasatospora sp. NPDC048286]|uniref:saccharopine dehydrogenase NADP-binding domain-containing protein n=1 Tax=Kitasatospora sp. NPDC048286 TaxID=3364047 RepID=UPI00372185E7
MSHSTEPLVGILGGYGAVGASAARCLAAEGGVRLRLGGRRAEQARRLAAGLGAEPVTVDAADDASLLAFGRGCDVVLNCAGPAYLLRDRPRRAAAAVGAAYVDVMDGGGTAPPDERTAVLSAGLSPGLSGLLPRLLAEGLARPLRFTGHYVGLGALTTTGAADYLLSLDRGYGVPLAGWRAGRVVPGALSMLPEHGIPGLPRPVTAYPYLLDEIARQAEELGLESADWYNGFDGHYLLDALNRQRSGVQDFDAACEELVRAGALDVVGREPYHVLWGALDGLDAEGAAVRRSGLIRGSDGSELTGVVGAAAVRELLAGRVALGAHQASRVLAPATVVEALRRHLPATVVAVTQAAPFDGGAEDDEFEDGEL